MTADDFIGQLEKQGLLPDTVVGALRRMVEDAPKTPSPEDLAKLLIERGQLTPFQAKKLLEVPTTHHARPAHDDVPVAKIAGQKPAQKPAAKPAPALQPLDDLGLAPLDAPALQPLGDELMPLDDVPVAKVAPTPQKPTSPKPAPATPAAQQKPAAKPAPAAQQKPAAKPTMPAKPADTGLSPLPALSPLDEALPPLTPAGPAAAAGGTADLLSDPLLSQADSLGGGSVLLPAKPKSFWESLFSGGGAAAGGAGGAARPASPWESPLILFGGGGLLLLTIIAVALYFALSSGSAQQAWDLAEKDYQEGAYASAIEKYDKFASSYYSDKRASEAKVKKAVAQLRIKTSAQDWPGALAVAKEVLPEAEKEEAFGEKARPDLVTLLPDILTGLVEKAKGTADQAAAKTLLAQAVEAQELVDNPAYLPTTARAELEIRLGKLKDQVIELDLIYKQDEELAKAITAIKAAAKPADAYEVRRKLIAVYPALDRNAELRAAMALAAQKDREAVKVTEGGPMAAAPTAAAPPGDTILVASRTGAAIEGGPGGILPVLAAGSIFGVDLAQGQALWRRPVGTGVLLAPLRLAQGEEDVLFYDGNLKALVRASGRTGEAKWQLPVPEEPFAPLVDGGRALVGFRAGELWQINLVDGSVTKQVKFPIPLAAGPAVEAGRFLVIAGEHTNLFVLDPETLACRAVTYCGHSAGSLGVPPAALLGHVLLAANTGGDVALVHTFALSSETSQLAAVGEPLRLTGRVRTAPVVARSRAVFTTDREEAAVLEVNPTDAKKPVTVVARAAARGRESVLTWPWFDGTQLWIAGRGVARFELQASRGQLGRLVETDPGAWLDAPLEKIGDVLYSVRRREGVPGWVVAATRVSNPANPRTETQHVWELTLGVPGIGAPVFDAQQKAILHATAAGDVYLISGADVKAGRASAPAARLPVVQPPLALAAEASLPSGERLFWSPGRSGVLWQRVEGEPELKPRALPVAGAQTKSAPGMLGDIALFGLSSGPVVGFKPGAIEPSLTYQPPLGPGETLAWKSPVAVRAEPPELLAADDRGRLLLLAQADAASIYLAAKAQVQIEGELLAPPACLGGVAVVAVRKDGKDAAAVYRLPQLGTGSRHELAGTCQFGPVVVGDGIYLATDRTLVCLSDAGEQRWKIDLAHGPLSGPPAADGTDLVIAYAAGKLARLKSADGSAAGPELDLGEPLRGPATTVGKRVLVGTPDGSLRFVPWPE